MNCKIIRSCFTQHSRIIHYHIITRLFHKRLARRAIQFKHGPAAESQADGIAWMALETIPTNLIVGYAADPGNGIGLKMINIFHHTRHPAVII